MSVFDTIKDQLNVKSEETPAPEPMTPEPVNDGLAGQNITIKPIGGEMFKHQGDQLGLQSHRVIEDGEEPEVVEPVSKGVVPGLAQAQQAMSDNPELAGAQVAGPDWNQGFENVIRGGGYNKSIRQAVTEYNKWAAENGQAPLDAFTIFPLLQRYDPEKSIQQNEDDEKKAKRQETYSQIGSVLSHIGNLVGTIMGAPNQNIQTPDFTERKRKLDAYTMQMRRQNANDMYGMLYKERADQRAADTARINNEYRIQMTEAAKNKDKRDAELALLQQERLKAQAAGDDARAREYEAEIKKKEAEINRLNELLPYEKKLRSAQAGSAWASAGASNARANATRNANEDWMQEAADWEKLKPEEFSKWAKTARIENSGQGTKALDNKTAKRFATKMRAKYGSLAKASKNKGTMPGVKGGGNNNKMPGVK